MSRIQTAAESSQAGRIWAAAQNLAELLLVTGKFLDDAPEPSWAEEFPPALCGLEAVRLEFSNFASVLGWPTPPDQFGLDEVAQALHSAGQLIDPAPEAPLCQYLGGASRDLVRETHIAWIESHHWDGEVPSPAQVYAWYWNETLGGAALDGAKVEEAAVTASAVAKWMGLDEVVEYLRDPDQVAYYGMMNILPATPIRWSLEDVDAADRLLHYGLARWYHRPLEASVVPIDVITGVLRTRRPYYYNRMLAHALVQTICAQRALPPGIVADTIVGKLAAFCDLMLVGYRLRCQYLPRLKTTPGWVEYLDALVALHFPRWATGTVHSFRRRADHLCCAGESPVWATELTPGWRSQGTGGQEDVPELTPDTATPGNTRNGSSQSLPSPPFWEARGNLARRCGLLMWSRVVAPLVVWWQSGFVQ